MRPSLLSHLRAHGFTLRRQYASATRSLRQPARPTPTPSPKPYKARKPRIPPRVRVPDDDPGWRQQLGVSFKRAFDRLTTTLLDTLASHYYRIIFMCTTIAVSLHLAWEHVVAFSPCSGPSMLPTINVRGDTLVISMLHRRGRGIKVGDVVSFWHPMNYEHRAVKRVVGMPGDYVLRDTPPQVGEEADAADAEADRWMVQVPEGHCWVAGDNLRWSRDSRHYGPVPLALIRGKVLAKYHPWTLLTGSPFQEVEDDDIDLVD